MKHFLPIIFLLLFLFVDVFSCKKDKEIPPDMGYSYFPEYVGRCIVYDVDSFYYNDFTKHIDTFKYQLKEKYQSAFLDNQNRRTMRVERYVKRYNPKIPYTSLPWILKNVYTANRTATTAETVEENIRYIKLAFPIKELQSWNGNAQNTFPPSNYDYAFFNVPRTVGKINFDSVLQVNQYDESNLVMKKLYIEKYARHIGLVYKQVIDVQSQPKGIPDSLLSIWLGTPIMQRITSGIQYTMTVNSFNCD
ncbi:MAG: hypothetical protein ABI315_08050 [Bacteroidia bacterium]